MTSPSIQPGNQPGARGSLVRAAKFTALLFVTGAWFCHAQETPQPSAAQSATQSDSSSKQKPNPAARHGDDFLVRGTVFTQEGFALPGAELNIRRSAEKKFRWHTISNSRGDFAVRVKMGADYEVHVRAKGYDEQSATLDAKTGDRFKDLVFRMQHQGGKKS